MERLMWKGGGMRAARIRQPTGGLPPAADVVIIGGGIIGVNVAYHLAIRGVSSVVLERNVLGSGTSWHAAGQVAQMRGGPRLYPLSMYAGDFYETIEAETTAVRPRFRRCGSLNVAQSEDRMIDLRRSIAHAALMGIDAREITPNEAAELAPGMRCSDLVGGVWIPRDGRVSPCDAVLAIAHGAARRGAVFFEGVAAVAVRTCGAAVTGVVTSRGEVATRMVIDCAGLWSSEPIASIGQRLPLHAVSHWYFVTEHVVDMRNRTLPVVRDADAQIYIRDYNAAFLVGAFEVDRMPAQLPCDERGYIEFADEPPTLADRVRGAANRFPVIGQLATARILNAPESFTPDGRPLVGLASDVDGLIIAAGLNSEGIIFGPGIGRTIAQMVIDGNAQIDTFDLDVARFDRFHENRQYLEARTTEALSMLFEMKYPHREPSAGRQLRLSPLHPNHVDAGARFTAVAGWEVPVCYAAAEYAADPPSHSLPRWYQSIADELRIARTSAAIADLSHCEIVQLTGEDIACLLAELVNADIVVDPGSVAVLDLGSPTGGVALRVQLVITHDGLTYLISAPGTGRRLCAVLRRARGKEFAISVVDATEKWAIIAVIGPRAVEAIMLLASHTDLETIDQSTAGSLHIAHACVLSVRTRFGDLEGWQLFVPPSQALRLHSELLCSAMELGGGAVGSAALQSLRIEAGQPAWGHEFTPDTPLPDRGEDIIRIRIQSSDIVVTAGDVLARNGGPVTTLISVGYDPTETGDFVGLARIRSSGEHSLDGLWTVWSGGHVLTANVTRG
jgi:glycine/D-amino acid oxidase-like deaminating enzyme/glycine cleavage system aminomethyltransferase T